MKSKQRNYVDRRAASDCGRIAEAFSGIGLIASGLQIGGFVLMIFVSIFAYEWMHHIVVGLVLSVVATVSTFVATAFGEVARRYNTTYALFSAILSIVSATVSFCCLNHPNTRLFICVIPIIFSGIFNLMAFVVYANFWAKSPRNGKEEYDLNAMPIEERYDRDSKDTKKFAVTLLVGLLVLGVTVSAVIPTEYFKNCDIVYGRIVSKMGSSNTSKYIEGYFDQLPKGYKDVDKIRAQYEVYKELATEFDESRTGVEARAALVKMYELKKADDRWDFQGQHKEARVYCDAAWKSGDYYLTIGEESDKDTKQDFSTNLPYLPQDISDLVDAGVEITVADVYRRYESGLWHTTRYSEWILGYELRYEYDGETYELSVDICKISSLSYSLDDGEFVLSVDCYATRDYYDMKLA